MDTRLKATVTYDISRVNANGFFDVIAMNSASNWTHNIPRMQEPKPLHLQEDCPTACKEMNRNLSRITSTTTRLPVASTHVPSIPTEPGTPPLPYRSWTCRYWPVPMKSVRLSLSSTARKPTHATSAKMRSRNCKEITRNCWLFPESTIQTSTTRQMWFLSTRLPISSGKKPKIKAITSRFILADRNGRLYFSFHKQIHYGIKHTFNLWIIQKNTLFSHTTTISLTNSLFQSI